MRLGHCKRAMVSSPKRVMILIDNPLRDLPAGLLLASDLCLDSDVLLTPTAQAAYEVTRWNPDLVLLNYLRVSNQSLVEKLVKWGVPFSVLDTEGGFFMKVPNSNENTYTKTILNNEFLRSQVRQFFIWGEELNQTLREREIYPQGSLQCLGTPRMDFYHPSFRNYYSSNDRGHESEKLILVNTSFAGNNPKFSKVENEKKMLIERFNYSATFIEQFFADLDKVMFAYIDLVKYLAEQLPHRKIYLRPHPFELDEPYRKALSGLKNVEIGCDGAVGDWIMRSKVLIHYECSTAIESAFAGVPNLSLANYRELRPMEHINTITHYVDSFEQMKEYIELVFNKQYVSPQETVQNLKLIEQKIFHKVDGLSYQRIAAALRKSILEDARSRSLVQNLRRTSSLGALLVRNVFKILKRGFLVPIAKRIDPIESQTILDRLEKVTGYSCLAPRAFFSESLVVKRKS
jgi:surface carbohydrate biosynthesis protein